ncbi:MAG: polysaccharide deacetylase family protein [Bacteroidales bacterium]|nr:polysaccharide deacetylase family protein [Bacteroidales bacterium]
MVIAHPPGIIKKIYHKLLWSFKGTPKELFLTFDDGPTPEITQWVLDELEKFNAKATFFCLGRNVEKHPEIYNKIINNGHSVGNHTYSHLNGWKTKVNEYLEDVELAKQFIDSKLYRPPYGKLKPLQKRGLLEQFKIVMWDVLSGDYDIKTDKNKCLENIINFSKSGSVIVMHDSVKAKENLYYVLPKILEYFSDKDYCFSSIK